MTRLSNSIWLDELVLTMVLSAAGLLAAWENGTALRPVERALILLASAWPETPTAAFSQISIGQRDALLLTLQEQLFGPRLTGLAKCPECQERLELTFVVADIRAPLPDHGDDLAFFAPASLVLSLAIDGYQVRFRLPNSTDLLAVVPTDDAGTSRRSLLRRCVLSVEKDGTDVTAPVLADLPEDVAHALAAQMELADPQGNVQLALDCPACGHQWLLTFDILTYLWTEIEDWARRTLREVHLLASAYGWSEQEILGLSARRRQLYLEMVLG